MTIEEFSNEFDVLLNSYAVNSSFELGQGILQLDEYEKSLLLTEAQESIVKDLYNGKLTGEGFESTEEQRRYLDALVSTLRILIYHKWKVILSFFHYLQMYGI